MFFWSENKIKWYDRAAKWTRYHEHLADEISPFLVKGEKICDLGCGTGHLAIVLANRGYPLTAIDISEQAIDFIRREIGKEQTELLETKRLSWNDIPQGVQWDTVIMNFTGDITREFEKYFSLCSRQLIYIMRRFNYSSVGNREHSQRYQDINKEMICAIERRGAVYETHEFEFEFGQPFISIEEALDYIRAYAKRAGGEKYLVEKIENTNNQHYPLYLPYKKRITICVIKK